MAMSFLTYLANKPRRPSFSLGSAGAVTACSPAACSPGAPPPGPEPGNARREQVERIERDISRRLKGLPADSCLGEVSVASVGTACSTEELTSSEGSFDSTFGTSGAALYAAGVPARSTSSSRLHVQRALSALSHFVRGDDQDDHSREESSHQRSMSLDTFGSDADDGPEELGRRRSGSLGSSADDGPEDTTLQPEVPRRRFASSPTEVSRPARASAELKDPADRQDQGQTSKKKKRAHRRSNSLDLGAAKGEAEVLRKLKLKAQEVGARNKTKWRRRVMWNQCFYLSIAHAYMGTGESDRQTKRLARKLRYAIEAAVLEQHPSWSQGLRDSAAGTGPPMVFADFLQIAMRVDSVPREKNFLSGLAVCVLDSVNGYAEAYVGPDYGSLASREDQESNFILLLHLPGHYCCLVRDDDQGSKVGMTYAEFKERLVEQDVFLVETMA